MENLLNKTILITGGAKNLGLHLCDFFINRGANVIAFDNDKEALQGLKNRSNLEAIYCDVTDPQQVDMKINDLFSKNKVDVLVNNAGIIKNGPLISLFNDKTFYEQVREWEQVIKVNLTAVYMVSSAVAKAMVHSRSHGLIVNISSVMAAGNAGQGAYSASKAAVNSLTKVWSKELGGLGIRCVAIAPGFIDVDSTKQAMPELLLEEHIKKTPLKKLVTPESIAKTILFAIDNEDMTGCVLTVDAGVTI